MALHTIHLMDGIVEKTLAIKERWKEGSMIS